jgi:2-dehydropantoate 2-reductase
MEVQMQLNIAVVGAGAIGGAVGAYLLRAGYRVTLIDAWPQHIETIRRDGLTVSDANGRFTVPARALHVGEVSQIDEPFDIVFLSVKAYDLVWSTHLITPRLAPGGCILPVMNALVDETVAQIVSHPRTVGCVPTISAGVYEPGHVVRTDPTTTHAFSVGELSGVITPRVRRLVEMLGNIGPSEATTNIWGIRWAKMVWNCMGNALAGLVGTARLTPEERALMDRLSVVTGCEAARVAMGLGIALESVNGIPADALADARNDDDIRALTECLAAVRAERQLTPEQAQRVGMPGRPSLAQDVLKKRRTEIEQLNGEIVRLGATLGIATPVNAAITELVREMEAGRWQPGADSLRRLVPHLGALGA